MHKYILVSLERNNPQNVIENRCQPIKLSYIYIIVGGSQLGQIVPLLLHYKCIKNFVNTLSTCTDY